MELQNGDYYKAMRAEYFYSNNYIGYESNDDREKNLSVVEYLKKIKPQLKNIFDLEKSDTWKSIMNLTIIMNFTSSKDTDEEWLTHSKEDNIEVMIYDNLDKTIEKLFDLLLSRYKIV